MYTANVVDTVTLRCLGRPPNRHHDELRRVLDDLDRRMTITATTDTELGSNSRVAGNPFADDLIEAGYCRVARPVEDPVDRAFGSIDERSSDLSTVAQARYHAFDVIDDQTRGQTVVRNAWRDTAIVGLVTRLFEANERLRVIVHTCDGPLERAVESVVPFLGYHDVRARQYDPGRDTKRRFPTREALVW